MAATTARGQSAAALPLALCRATSPLSASPPATPWGPLVPQKGSGKLGYESEAFAIYDTMRYIKPPVVRCATHRLLPVNSGPWVLSRCAELECWPAACSITTAPLLCALLCPDFTVHGVRGLRVWRGRDAAGGGRARAASGAALHLHHDPAAHAALHADAGGLLGGTVEGCRVVASRARHALALAAHAALQACSCTS